MRPWLGMVRQASLVQTAPDRLEYLLVANEAMGSAEEKLLASAAQASLPSGIHFTLRRVQTIPAGSGGKAKPFVALT